MAFAVDVRAVVAVLAEPPDLVEALPGVHGVDAGQADHRGPGVHFHVPLMALDTGTRNGHHWAEHLLDVRCVMVVNRFKYLSRYWYLIGASAVLEKFGWIGENLRLCCRMFSGKVMESGGNRVWRCSGKWDGGKRDFNRNYNLRRNGS